MPLQIRRSVGSNFTLPPLPAGGCEPLQIRRSIGSNFTLPPLPADINDSIQYFNLTDLSQKLRTALKQSSDIAIKMTRI